jgi:hypothetical protein
MPNGDNLAVAFTRVDRKGEASVSEPCADAESKGCKGPAPDQGVDLNLEDSQEPRCHYCRGCVPITPARVPWAIS